MNKITAIIPARGGSKSVPRKNIRMLGMHPLIAHSIITGLNSKNIDRVIVSTEDDEIASIARKYKAEILERPMEFATDDATDDDYLNHFFENIDVDEVALLRPTTPFRNSIFVDDVIDLYFKKKNEITGLRTMMEVTSTPYKLFQMENGLAKGFFDEYNGISDYANLPRQMFPKTYDPNGHIDIVKYETLKSGSVFGDKLYLYIDQHMIDIDTKEDFEYAEYKALQLNKFI